jgi:hypothetical protein
MRHAKTLAGLMILVSLLAATAVNWGFPGFLIPAMVPEPQTASSDGDVQPEFPSTTINAVNRPEGGHLLSADEKELSPTTTMDQVTTTMNRDHIPVATANGVVFMSERQYECYIWGMGHLPVLSNSYVFGRTIPMPKTDRQGHIPLPDTGKSVRGPIGPATLKPASPQTSGCVTMEKLWPIPENRTAQGNRSALHNGINSRSSSQR